MIMGASEVSCLRYYSLLISWAESCSLLNRMQRDIPKRQLLSPAASISKKQHDTPIDCTPFFTRSPSLSHFAVTIKEYLDRHTEYDGIAGGALVFDS